MKTNLEGITSQALRVAVALQCFNPFLYRATLQTHHIKNILTFRRLVAIYNVAVNHNKQYVNKLSPNSKINLILVKHYYNKHSVELLDALTEKLLTKKYYNVSRSIEVNDIYTSKGKINLAKRLKC